jgi:hypothetical protein
LTAKRAARREAAVPSVQGTLCWATFAPTKTLIENDSATHMISFYTSRIIILVLCRPKIFVHGAGFYF